MSKKQDDIGKRGQERAARHLSALGIECLEKIGSPIKAIPVVVKNIKNVYRVIWGEKVAGDHRGILPGGRSVLVETKTILDRNLVWSDFREHQPEKLSEHARHGGLSLVVWVHSSGIYVMQWPFQIGSFGPGKGINAEIAEQLDKRTRAYVNLCLTDNIQNDLNDVK